LYKVAAKLRQIFWVAAFHFLEHGAASKEPHRTKMGPGRRSMGGVLQVRRHQN
jgi:hypothetical protein